MDKDSQSPPQPSSGIGRGTRSRRARSVSTPSAASSNAPSVSSSSVRRLSSVCRYSLNPDTHPRLLLSWTRDGIHNLLPHLQAGHEIMKKWLVLFKQYRTPIRF